MSAVALFAMNIVGFGLGPLVVGYLSDFFGGDQSLRYALMSCLVFMPWACVHYLLAARTYRADLQAKNRE